MQLLLSAFIGIAMAAALIHGVNSTIRPQLTDLARSRLHTRMTHISNLAVEQALEQQDLHYSDLVLLQSLPGEGITAFSTDTVRLNALRTQVMEEVVNGINALDAHCLDVPLGAVTGVDLFSALGPKLPVQVLSAASVDGTFRNDFLSAGINQTLHRIYLDITVTAKVLLPGGTVETTISTPVCVAETVIVGQVPQTFLAMHQ